LVLLLARTAEFGNQVFTRISGRVQTLAAGLYQSGVEKPGAMDEVGYLSYGPDAANVLFHVVNVRHLKKRPMIFTTNKPLNQ